jgi:hypothetical protein
MLGITGHGLIRLTFVGAPCSLLFRDVKIVYLIYKNWHVAIEQLFIYFEAVFLSVTWCQPRPLFYPKQAIRVRCKASCVSLRFP